MNSLVRNILLALLALAASIIALNSMAQTAPPPAPELTFINPVLVSGTANTQGAVYRFASVTAGVDAELKLKKFSRPDITMSNVDLATLGWNKALQPQFGLAGNVAPYQKWFIDFELNFFKAGTSDKQKMQRVVFTALDIDGDGLSISEYARFANPNITAYSSLSNLGGQSPLIVMDANGESTTTDTCDIDNLIGKVKFCPRCNGTGVDNGSQCDDCDGSGLLFKDCHHAYSLQNTSQGTIQNFADIDTSATQVMVTYTYLNKDKISFTYGATSSAAVSNAGIRLNSLWGKQFSLAPMATLPLKLTAFNATLDKTNVNLSWQTASEHNLNHFTVERSYDGKSYTDVALVFANGNTTAQSSYSYKDGNVTSANGTVFYRLRMTDAENAEVSYSGVRVVRVAKEAAPLTLVTFPNPAASDVRITLPNAWQGRVVTLALIGANGVQVKALQLSAASQTENLSLSGVTKGLYVVKATCGTEVAQQRIVKN